MSNGQTRPYNRCKVATKCLSSVMTITLVLWWAYVKAYWAWYQTKDGQTGPYTRYNTVTMGLCQLWRHSGLHNGQLKSVLGLFSAIGKPPMSNTVHRMVKLGLILVTRQPPYGSFIGYDDHSGSYNRHRNDYWTWCRTRNGHTGPYIRYKTTTVGLSSVITSILGLKM